MRSLLLAVLFFSAPEIWFTGSEAYSLLRRAGGEVAAEKRVDIDGDDLPEVLVAERYESGIGLSAWRVDEKGKFTLLGRLPVVPGDELARFELTELVPGRRTLWMEVVEESPDEADHYLRLVLFEPTPRTVLETEFRVQHPEDEAGRERRQVLWISSARVGVEIMAQTGSPPKVRLRKDPKTIALQGRSGPLWATIGIGELVYAWSGDSYRLESESYLDFLPAVSPLQARVQLEGTEQEASALVDGSWENGWNWTKGSALRLTVKAEKTAPIILLRLVLGCQPASDLVAWSKRMRKLVVDLGQLPPIEVELGRPPNDERLAGTGEFLLPSGHGAQFLLFLRRPVETPIVKMQLESREESFPSEGLCLAEISLHRALVPEQP